MEPPQPSDPSGPDFLRMAETVPQMIWTVNRDGITDFSNPWTIEYTGMSPKDARETGWLECIYPEHRDFARSAWNHSAASGEPYECEYLLRRASDGKYRWHLSRARPWRAKDSTILQWVGSTTDIDRQKRQNIELIEALRARNEFLAIAAHECRTPLTALKLQIEIAKAWMKSSPKHPAQENAIRMLDSSDDQIGSLAELIADLLEVPQSHSEDSRKLRCEKLDLVSLVRLAVDRLATLILDSGCQVEVQDKGPVAGTWDRHRIDQVIVNLLTNALKYGAGKPVKIYVESMPEGAARISVHDQGPGIASENHSKIFECFQRVAIDPSISGSGLGLYIAQQGVTAHGGTIWVESQPGLGSTFRVELPGAKKRSHLTRPPAAFIP